MEWTAFKAYLEIVIFSVPVYSSMTCTILMMLTYRDSICDKERKIRFLLIFYYLFALIIWEGTILFNYQYSLFIYLNPIFYLSLLLASVTLYHFIYYLTATDKESRFSRWHYLPPFVIFFVIFIWSLFIPYNVQYAIISANDGIIPEYKYYSVFYASKHVLRVAYLIIYVSLCIYKLRIYTKIYGHMYKKYTLWLWYLMVLSIVVITIALIATIASYSHMHKLLKNVFIVFLIAIGHIILVYNIIRRNYHLDCSDKENADKRQIPLTDNNTDKYLKVSDNIATSKRKMYTRYQKTFEEKNISPRLTLTKKSFEHYVKKYKPYLNPNFQMTDLVEPFEVNRTYISRFINTEYGMNFSRYLNRHRMHELDILLTLPSNKNKDIKELVSKVGFGSFRSYLRAKQIEDEYLYKESE